MEDIILDKEAKENLKSELNKLYEKYGFDCVKLTVDVEDFHRFTNKIRRKRRQREVKMEIKRIYPDLTELMEHYKGNVKLDAIYLEL